MVAMVDSFEFLLLGNSYCLVKLYDAAQCTFQQNLCFVTQKTGWTVTYKKKSKLNFFYFYNIEHSVCSLIDASV